MKSVMSFVFDEAPVRVHRDENGNPWFVAKDVCDILEIANVSKAVNCLDEDEQNTITISDSITPQRGNPNMLVVSDSGLYALIFRSRKPEARRFRKWVTSEVLPAIRANNEFSLDMFTEEIKGELSKLAPPVQREMLRAVVTVINKHPEKAENWSKFLLQLCRMFVPSGGASEQRPVQGSLF